jgi:hypothetical protein
MRLAYPPYLAPALQRRTPALKAWSRYKVEENNPLDFSLGSQFQPETVSLIIPIVVVMANSP